MITQDIKPSWGNWLNVVRRLQETGCKQGGLAIAKMIVVLNSNGEPIYWLNPEVKLVEPKNKITEEEFLILVKVYGDEILT